MLEKILVAVDGSKHSRRAAQFAHQLAAQTGAKLCLLFVVEPPRVIPIAPLDSFAITPHVLSPAETVAVSKLLDEIAADLPRAKVDKQVVVGAPAPTIIEQAQEQNADLIVVGARGLGPGGRWLLGSVSDRVVHQAGRPVTVVP